VQTLFYIADALLINTVLKVLSPKAPKYASAPRTQAIADTRTPAKLLFGTVNVAGMHTLPPITTSGTSTTGVVYPGAWTHRIQTLATHECDSFADVYVEQTLIANKDISTTLSGTLSAGSVLTGPSKYVGDRQLMIRRYTGTATQAVDYILNTVDGTAFPATFQGLGMTYAAVTANFNATIFPNGLPPISFVVHGMKCYDPRKDTTNGGSGSHRYATQSTWSWTNNPILHAATLTMLDKRMGGGAADPTTDINWTTVAAAAAVCEVGVPSASPWITYAASTNASISGNLCSRTGGSTGSGVGVASTVGMSKGSMQVMDVAGQLRCFAGLTTIAPGSPGSHDYTYTYMDYCWELNDSASPIRAYVAGTVVATVPAADVRTNGTNTYRIDYDGAYMKFIFNGKIYYTVAASVNASFYFMSDLYTASSSFYVDYQQRYTNNIELECTTLFEDNVAKLLYSALGKAFEQGGVWNFYAGGWSTPTFTVNQTDWIGPLSIQAVAPRQEGRWNAVTAWYYDPMRNWQRVPSFTRYNNTYIAVDGGERITVEIDQPGCNDESEAQRKAEAILIQSRNGIHVTGKLGPKFQYLAMFETGILNYASLGWTSKTFRLLGYTLNDDGSVSVSFGEEQSTDWADLTTNDENLPSLTPLPATNGTTPGVPQNFTVVPDEGFLRFDWDVPIVMPLYAQYQLARSVSSDMAVNSIVWQGLTDKLDLLADPRSPYWYAVRAVTNSAQSGFNPSTYGLYAVPYPAPSAYRGAKILPDGDFTYATSRYWLLQSVQPGAFLSNSNGLYTGRGLAYLPPSSAFFPQLFPLNPLTNAQDVGSNYFPMSPGQKLSGYFTAKCDSPGIGHTLTMDIFAARFWTPTSYTDGVYLGGFSGNVGSLQTFVGSWTMPSSPYRNAIGPAISGAAVSPGVTVYAMQVTGV
jgi:hypothetical protein